MSLIQDDEQSGGEVDSHNEEAGVPHTAASVQRLVTGKNYGNNCLSILCRLLLLFDGMRLPCFPIFSFSSFFLSFVYPILSRRFLAIFVELPSIS